MALQSDNYWLNSRTPCITYGLRGLVYFKLTVSGPARDPHSGVFGRMVHEPMTDLIQLMSKLVASDGTILVPGVDDMVSIADAEEKSAYRYQCGCLGGADERAPRTHTGRSTRSWTTPSRTSRTRSARRSRSRRTRWR